ncbi:hypothetical protein V8J82_14150 [Gymnodinialimonas sp. 2305UL16-5]|uniref:hypothetical protein n=1 Tax=Gymnodinialimonas mytili TaxID=3126503 RepID=UPI0030AB269E
MSLRWKHQNDVCKDFGSKVNHSLTLSLNGEDMKRNEPLAFGILLLAMTMGTVAAFAGYSFSASVLVAISCFYGISFTAFLALLVAASLRPSPEPLPLRHDISGSGFVERGVVVSLEEHRSTQKEAGLAHSVERVSSQSARQY